MNNYCDCISKIILEKGDGQHIAVETFCPTHGYSTSCYKCTKAYTTELCRKHSYAMTKQYEDWFKHFIELRDRNNKTDFLEKINKMLVT